MTINKWDVCYSKGRDFTHIHPELLEKAAGLGDKSMCALDFGCGTGKNSVALANLGFTVQGIDQSHEAISLAKKRSKTIAFTVGNEENIPHKKYDLILVSLVYKFIADKKAFLKKLHSCLSNGGKLLMYNPTQSSKDIAINEQALTAALLSTGFKQVNNINTSYCGNDILIMTSATKEK